MVLSLCLAAGPVIVESDSEPGTGSAASYDPDPFRNAGSIVTFGMYEQDGDAHNGKESIEWIALDVQENQALTVFSGPDRRRASNGGSSEAFNRYF